jgi:hypothetical protein
MTVLDKPETTFGNFNGRSWPRRIRIFPRRDYWRLIAGRAGGAEAAIDRATRLWRVGADAMYNGRRLKKLVDPGRALDRGLADIRRRFHVPQAFRARGAGRR